ncbi:MAG: hypothetical protein JNL08_15920 [Planctomycetes bacterium]|nr:hypothetical protein [Planctomycetota bacterium]
MDSAADATLSQPLPRPRRGGSTRVRFAGGELVLEATRGGHALLWLDGTRSRRFALGLAAEGELRVCLAAPRLPVRVVTRDTLTLAPKSRLHGYVQVPLVPMLFWHAPGAALQRLVELPRDELAAEWDDRDGTVYRCTSPFHVRYPVPAPTPRANVPVWLANPTETTASPGYVPLLLRDEDLRELRGGIATAPVRLRWTGHALAAVARPRTEVPL